MTIENCDVIRKVFRMNELGGLAQNIAAVIEGSEKGEGALQAISVAKAIFLSGLQDALIKVSTTHCNPPHY